MPKYDVTLFKSYPFAIGQKIRIENSPREGDWEVIALSRHKVTLRCPISKKEIEADRFCYLLEEKKNFTWPQD